MSWNGSRAGLPLEAPFLFRQMAEREAQDCPARPIAKFFGVLNAAQRGQIHRKQARYYRVAECRYWVRCPLRSARRLHVAYIALTRNYGSERAAA